MSKRYVKEKEDATGKLGWNIKMLTSSAMRFGGLKRVEKKHRSVRSNQATSCVDDGHVWLPLEQARELLLLLLWQLTELRVVRSQLFHILIV